MGRILVTAPTDEPLELALVKEHLRVDGEEDDRVIEALIVAARQKVESDTWRALMTQTWGLSLDAFPANNGPIALPLPPLQTVDSIKYIDTAGTEQTFEAANYKADAVSEPGRVALAYGQAWPSTREEINAVTVQFTAGYGDAGDVPEGLKEAMKLLIGHWYENREASIAGTVIGEVPMAYEALIGQYRIWSFS